MNRLILLNVLIWSLSWGNRVTPLRSSTGINLWSLSGRSDLYVLNGSLNHSLAVHSVVESLIESIRLRANEDTGVCDKEDGRRTLADEFQGRLSQQKIFLWRKDIERVRTVLKSSVPIRKIEIEFQTSPAVVSHLLHTFEALLRVYPANVVRLLNAETCDSLVSILCTLATLPVLNVDTICHLKLAEEPVSNRFSWFRGKRRKRPKLDVIRGDDLYEKIQFRSSKEVLVPPDVKEKRFVNSSKPRNYYWEIAASCLQLLVLLVEADDQCLRVLRHNTVLMSHLKTLRSAGFGWWLNDDNLGGGEKRRVTTKDNEGICEARKKKLSSSFLSSREKIKSALHCGGLQNSLFKNRASVLAGELLEKMKLDIWTAVTGESSKLIDRLISGGSSIVKDVTCYEFQSNERLIKGAVAYEPGGGGTWIPYLESDTEEMQEVLEIIWAVNDQLKSAWLSSRKPPINRPKRSSIDKKLDGIFRRLVKQSKKSETELKRLKETLKERKNQIEQALRRILYPPLHPPDDSFVTLDLSSSPNFYWTDIARKKHRYESPRSSSARWGLALVQKDGPSHVLKCEKLIPLETYQETVKQLGLRMVLRSLSLVDSTNWANTALQQRGLSLLLNWVEKGKFGDAYLLGSTIPEIPDLETDDLRKTVETDKLPNNCFLIDLLRIIERPCAFHIQYTKKKRKTEKDEWWNWKDRDAVRTMENLLQLRRLALEILYIVAKKSSYAVEICKHPYYFPLFSEILHNVDSIKNRLDDKDERLASILISLLGCIKWTPKNPGHSGLRILCLDGGGSRGIITIGILKQLQSLLSPNLRLSEIFDVICGTSTGGIIAVLIGMENLSVATTENVYDALVTHVFQREQNSTPGDLGPVLRRTENFEHQTKKKDQENNNTSNPVFPSLGFTAQFFSTINNRFTTLGRLISRQAYYDERYLEKVLHASLGNRMMFETATHKNSPKVFCLSTKLSATPSEIVVWRNYTCPPPFVSSATHPHANPAIFKKDFTSREGTSRISCSEALRATTAAPLFFAPVRRIDNTKSPHDSLDNCSVPEAPQVNIPFGGVLNIPGKEIVKPLKVVSDRKAWILANQMCASCYKRKFIIASYADGAILANNPAGIAVSEAQKLFPGIPIECVVSIGTGKNTSNSNSIQLPLLPRVTSLSSEKNSGLGWGLLISHLIASATNTELIHDVLESLLPSDVYFRFNPRLDSIGIDETRPEKMNMMKTIARRYFSESHSNKEKLNRLVKLLSNRETKRTVPKTSNTVLFFH